jgi:hypothetical protein
MDVVTYGADARQFFDVHAQMVNAASRTSAAVGDTRGFDGFLKGEGRVTHQAKFLAASLLEARSAADVLQSGLQATIFSTRIPLAGALGGIALAEGLKFINEEAAKTQKAFKDLGEELGKPFGAQIHQTSEAIGADLQALETKISSLQTRQQSFFGRIVHGFSRGRDDITESVNEGQSRALKLAEAQGDAELRVVAIKEEALTVSAAEAEVAQIRLDFENKRAALLKSVPFGPVTENVAKRLEALDRGEDVAKRTAREKNKSDNEALAHARELADIDRRGLGKQDQTIAKLSSELAYRLRILDAARKLGDIRGIAAANVGVAQAQAGVADARADFYKNIGPHGHSIADITQQIADEAEIKAGEALVAQLRQDRAKGVSLGPIFTKYLDEADKLDKASQAGLSALSGQDFSGLAALGNLPFSGLQTLNGLTITIQ